MEDATQVAAKLGLDEVHRVWLAKLEETHPLAILPAPNTDAHSALLARLDVAKEDAAEVLETMPSPDRDPESWWLLERSHAALLRNLASHENQPAWEPIPPLPPAFRLFAIHLILVSVAAIRQRHKEFGLPGYVSWETLSYAGRAVTAYRNKHYRAGIELSGWDWLRFSAWFYQVGRLEVTPYWLLTHPQAAGPLFWYDTGTAAQLGPGHQKGAAALSLHIPAADPLTPEACSESLRRIRISFNIVQPGGPPRIATCTSRLLDEQWAEYLPEDSNIISFQRRFTLVPGARDNDEAVLHFVCGSERPKELQALPRRTTLERAVRASALDGCSAMRKSFGQDFGFACKTWSQNSKGEGELMPPTFANGKICYIEMPATDIARSSEFYKQVFGWNTRKRGDGSIAFDDTVGAVSGTWVKGRPPQGNPGLMVYIMVDNAVATIEAIVANGGEIVQPIGADAPEITARFRDPAGNVIGLYQQPA